MLLSNYKCDGTIKCYFLKPTYISQKLLDRNTFLKQLSACVNLSFSKLVLFGTCYANCMQNMKLTASAVHEMYASTVDFRLDVSHDKCMTR